jgi:hypothetical protein
LIYLSIAAIAVWRLRKEKSGLLLALPGACLLTGLLSLDQYRTLRQDRLIVYSNGRQALAERVAGRHFYPLIGQGVENYNAKAAHTGWQAWRTSGQNAFSPYLFINDKNVYFLTDTSTNAYRAQLPVDVLVICRPLRGLQVAGVLKAFSPETVVLAQRPSAYHYRRWSDSCAANGMRLINVAEDGAFIME